jgi:acetylornithine aminotransferase
VAAALLDSGVIVNAANESTIRIAPPLIVTTLQIEKFISLFTKVLKEVHHG